MAGSPGAVLKFTVIAPPTVNGLVIVRNIVPSVPVVSLTRLTIAESILDMSTVSGTAVIGCAKMLTVADDVLMVGADERLNTWAVLIVTLEPAGEVMVIVTLSG